MKPDTPKLPGPTGYPFPTPPEPVNCTKSAPKPKENPGPHGDDGPRKE